MPSGPVKCVPAPTVLMMVPLSSEFPFAACAAFERAVNWIVKGLFTGESFTSTTASTPGQPPGFTIEEDVSFSTIRVSAPETAPSLSLSK